MAMCLIFNGQMYPVHTKSISEAQIFVYDQSF